MQRILPSRLSRTICSFYIVREIRCLELDLSDIGTQESGSDEGERREIIQAAHEFCGRCAKGNNGELRPKTEIMNSLVSIDDSMQGLS